MRFSLQTSLNVKRKSLYLNCFYNTQSTTCANLIERPFYVKKITTCLYSYHLKNFLTVLRMRKSTQLVEYFVSLCFTHENFQPDSCLECLGSSFAVINHKCFEVYEWKEAKLAKADGQIKELCDCEDHGRCVLFVYLPDGFFRSCL